MAKGTKNKAQSAAAEAPEKRAFEIKGGKLKDEHCDYKYEVMTGLTAGDKLNRDGSNIIHEDLREAFSALDVHLALICEEAELGKNETADDHQDFDGFFVSGFQVDGIDDNEWISLTGDKRLTTGDFVGLKTPKIKKIGFYKHKEELWTAIEKVKEEVLLYMNGKSEPKPEQQEIEFDENKEHED